MATSILSQFNHIIHPTYLQTSIINAIFFRPPDTNMIHNIISRIQPKRLNQMIVTLIKLNKLLDTKPNYSSDRYIDAIGHENENDHIKNIRKCLIEFEKNSTPLEVYCGIKEVKKIISDTLCTYAAKIYLTHMEQKYLFQRCSDHISPKNIKKIEKINGFQLLLGSTNLELAIIEKVIFQELNSKKKFRQDITKLIEEFKKIFIGCDILEIQNINWQPLHRMYLTRPLKEKPYNSFPELPNIIFSFFKPNDMGVCGITAHEIAVTYSTPNEKNNI